MIKYLTGIDVDGNVKVTHEPFSASWNGDYTVPTKTSMYDELNAKSDINHNHDSDYLHEFGTSALTSMNTIPVTSGKYRWNSVSSGRPVSGLGNEYGTVLSLNYDGDQANQLAHDILGNNLYFRTLTTSSDTATNWTKIWHDGNLTNVSQLTNDAGYLTAETDSQTLSWAEANNVLTISNGNAIIISGFAESDHTHSNYLLNTTDILTGDLSVTGNVNVQDEVYGSLWNSNLGVPTKNAIYDKFESFSSDVVTLSTNQSISGQKSFSGTTVLGGPLTVISNTLNIDSLNTPIRIRPSTASKGTYVNGYAQFWVDPSSNLSFNPDPSVVDQVSNSGYTFVTANTGRRNYTFPDASGTIALTSDMPSGGTDFVATTGGTYTGDISVPDEVYGVAWDASLEVPTKNAVYDKIESLTASDINSATFNSGTGDLFLEKNDLTNVIVNLDGRYPLFGHLHEISNVNGLQAALDGKADGTSLSNYQLLSEKGAVNGYAPLDGGGKIASQYLPAFVDDVLEYANLAAFPATGSSGILYIAADTNFTYRWSGTAYTQIGGGGAGEVDSVFGRVGAITAQVGDYSAFYSQLGHTHTFASLTSKPTTLSGYGITDAATSGHTHSQYLLNTTDTLTGNLTVTGQGTFGTSTGAGDVLNLYGNATGDANNVYIQFKDSAGANQFYIGDGGSGSSDITLYNYTGLNYLRVMGTGGVDGLHYNWNGGSGKVYHAGTDMLHATDKYLEFQANSTWGAKLRVGGNGRTASGSTASVTTTNGNLHLDSGFGGYATYLNYYAGTNGVYFGNGASGIAARMYSDGNLFKGSDQSTPYWHASNDGDFTRFRQVLGASQDLNTYTSTGMYHQNSNADAGTGTNYPISAAGVLTVKADEGFIYQEYQTYREYGQQYRRQYYSGAWSAWSEVWTSGQDGAGSGLDADLLDGLDSDRYHRGAVGSIAGNVDWNNYTAHGAYKVQAANMTSTYNAPSSYQYGILVVDRSEFGGEDRTLQTYYPHRSDQAPQTRMRNGAGWTSWMTRWNDGGNNTTSGAVGALRFHTGYDSGITASFSCSNWFRSSGTTGWYSQTYGGGIYMTDSNNVRVYASKGLQLDGGGSLYFAASSTGTIQRYEPNAGYMVGSYNHRGDNRTRSNPIYTIGSNYKPNDSDLGNMYGIGYTSGASATFLNSIDLGSTPSGWGLYVAGDGNARHFLDGNNGISHQSGVAYASNFILNSDKRRKNNIKEYDPTDLQVQWKSFELNSEEGVFRVGVVAQELLETNPEFVDQSSPESLTVKYIDLHSASLANHSALLAKKDKEIADLTQRIEKLEELIKNFI